MSRKLISSLGIAILAVVLTASAALAAPPIPTPRAGNPIVPLAGLLRHAHVGVVKSLAAHSFVLTTKHNGDVTVLVTGQTRFHIPTLKKATFADLEKGDRVAVNGAPGRTGFTAKQVVVAPRKPAIQHRVGVVTAYTPGVSITIKLGRGDDDADDARNARDVNAARGAKRAAGDLVTFKLTGKTVIRGPKGVTTVAVGNRVTVVARRDPATDTFTASAIVVHPPKSEP
jgi:hypothetical protein